MEVAPIVPAQSKAGRVLKAAALLLAGLSPLLAPVSALGAAIVGGAAFVAGFVGGHVDEQPTFLAGRALVSPALAALLGTLGGGLYTQALVLPDTQLRTGLLLVGAVCCILAGKALPQSKR